MKHIIFGAALVLAVAVHAAEPPATTAEPAVPTSPTPEPAAAESAQARGNPRRQEVQAGTAPAAATPSSTPAPRTGQPAARGNNDRIELGTTEITGNSELPKVMYVVPWKRPELGDLNGRPAKSLLDEVLAPVDRDVFRRQNRYYDALRPDAAAASPEGEK